MDNELDLPLKARQALVIKKINCLLAQDETDIMKDGPIMILK